MRLSKLMCGVALAGVTLAGGAQAAVVTIKVGGTYTAGSGASLPGTGPVSGELIVNATPYQYSSDFVFFIQAGSYLTFGSGAERVDFIPVYGDEGDSMLIQSGGGNNQAVLRTLHDTVVLKFPRVSTDPTELYDFSDTPVSVEFAFMRQTSDLVRAIGGWPEPGFYRPTANLTFTTATGAVPEPATWALMIGGFGLAGATLRGRRTAAVAA